MLNITAETVDWSTIQLYAKMGFVRYWIQNINTDMLVSQLVGKKHSQKFQR